MTVGELTPADKALLKAYHDFGTYSGAAAELGLAVQTVKNRGSQIIAKLEVNSIAQAVGLWATWQAQLRWREEDAL